MSAQLTLDLSAPPRPSLDNFVPGSNGEAVAALRRWAAAAGEDRVIYLWGAPGAGKTHLLQAAVEAASGRGHARYRWSQAAPFDALEPSLQFLAVDDVDGFDDHGQAELFSLLRLAMDGGVRVLAAGSAAPAALHLRADVRTRLGAGLVFNVRALTDDEKIAVLRQHACERGFELADEGALYLLRHNPRDLPRLLALLDAIDRYSLQHKRPVTLPLLREVTQQDLFSDQIAGVVEAGDPLRPIDDQ